MNGGTHRVLVENKQMKEGWFGPTDTYLRMNFPSERDVWEELVYVTVTDAWLTL